MALRRTEPIPAASPRRSVPLFDPHGIGALSAEDEGQAAESSSTVKGPQRAEVGADTHKHGLRRGRRRRSSEYVDVEGAQPASVSTQVVDEEDRTNAGLTRRTETQHSLPEVPLSPTSRLWWQRAENEAQNAGRVMSAERPHPFVATSSLDRTARSRQTSGASTSQSPSVQSPAAAFLSSMNDMLSSPTNSNIGSGSGTWPASYRTYSLSPPRQDIGLPRSGGTFEAGVFASPSIASISSSGPEAQALSGAANQLLHATDGKLHSHSSPPLQVTALRPDDEGARFGPHGRYIMGRRIGSGAFSTIREAWDLGERGTDGTDTEALGASHNWHRVAVKIVYIHEEVDKDIHEAYNELEMWTNLPAHRNILPLLYHERIKGEEHGSMNVKSVEAIDLLVMPYCEANLLRYVRTGGNLVEAQTTASSSRSGSIVGSGLHRTASLRNEKRSQGAAQEFASNFDRSRMQYGRTGSGFVPHDHRSNTSAAQSERLVSAPLSMLVGGRSASFAAPNPAAPASILRAGSLRHRGSIKEPQSRGVSIQTAKDILRQLTEALICLHHKAAVLHGDLKLENVLGQQRQTIFRRTSLAGDTEDGRGDEGLSPVLESDNDGEHTVASPICWRLADFGLSRRVPSKSAGAAEKDGILHTSHHTASRHPSSRMHFDGPQMRSASVSAANSLQNRLNGGSLAYTAPEAFVVPDSNDGDDVSPYAPDMWALGCIMYALFAGYLPFMDAFEPRLQSKIAQGHWEMPERLKTRRRRQESEPQRATSMQKGGSQSANRCSAAFGSAAVSPSTSMRRLSGVADLSASLPALPSRRDSAFRSRVPFSPSTQTILQNDEENNDGDSVVFVADDIDEGEEDEEDDDEGPEDGMEGTVKDRAAARMILRGLLEPDASKRLTIRQLAAMPWISGLNDAPVKAESAAGMLFDPIASAQSREEENAAERADQDLPASLRRELDQSALQQLQSRSEDERSPTDDEEQEDFLDRGRARQRQRDVESRSRSSVKPIDIDRSKSRSRSRAREESPIWALDAPQGGGFNWRQQQRDQQSSYGAGEGYVPQRQRPARVSDRPSSSSAVRSSSVDIHTKRGRSTSKAAPESSSTRFSSRSVSRNRRIDLDLVMPQLSRPRSTASSADMVSGGGALTTSSESRDSSPALPIAPDEHSVSRSSIWKSPLRARDRLANLIGAGGSGESSSSRTSQERQEGEVQAQESRTNDSQRLWWQR